MKEKKKTKDEMTLFGLVSGFDPRFDWGKYHFSKWIYVFIMVGIFVVRIIIITI